MEFEMPQSKPFKKVEQPWQLIEDPKLREAARIKKASELLSNGRELAEGLEINDGGEKRYVPSHTDPKHPHYPLTWNRHHDTLAAISPDGHLMVTPWTKSKEDQLRSLFNSKDESIGVPFSNNEMPSHPDVRKRWEKAQTLARMEKLELEREQEKNSKQ